MYIMTYTTKQWYYYVIQNSFIFYFSLNFSHDKKKEKEKLYNIVNETKKYSFFSSPFSKHFFLEIKKERKHIAKRIR